MPWPGIIVDALDFPVQYEWKPAQGRNCRIVSMGKWRRRGVCRHFLLRPGFLPPQHRLPLFVRKVTLEAYILFQECEFKNNVRPVSVFCRDNFRNIGEFLQCNTAFLCSAIKAITSASCSMVPLSLKPANFGLPLPHLPIQPGEG